LLRARCRMCQRRAGRINSRRAGRQSSFRSGKADMTSPAELETWLAPLFPEAAIESRPVNYLMRQNLDEELNKNQLFRIEPKDPPPIQVGVTAKALERLGPTQLQSGLRRAIASATRETKRRDELRFLVTASEVIVCEGKKSKR